MFSDYSDHMNAKPICLHCLVEDGDEDLGRGLDLARKYGHVDFDVRTCGRADVRTGAALALSSASGAHPRGSRSSWCDRRGSR